MPIQTTVPACGRALGAQWGLWEDGAAPTPRGLGPHTRRQHRGRMPGDGRGHRPQSVLPSASPRPPASTWGCLPLAGPASLCTVRVWASGHRNRGTLMFDRGPPRPRPPPQPGQKAATIPTVSTARGTGRLSCCRDTRAPALLPSHSAALGRRWGSAASPAPSPFGPDRQVNYFVQLSLTPAHCVTASTSARGTMLAPSQSTASSRFLSWVTLGR